MKKIENSPFDPFVKWFFPKLLPWVPSWLTANHISIIGHIGSFLAFLSLSLSNHSAFYGVFGAFFIFLHWFADTLDGVVARARKTTHLGFYLDHFGDSLGVVLIGLGIFMTPGSHIVIGLWCIVCYLIVIVSELVKMQILDQMELPVIGPTEIHLLLIVLVVTQSLFLHAMPVPWLSEVLGKDGSLTQLLGSQSGLTLVDTAGVVFLIVAIPLIIGTVVSTIRAVRRKDLGGGS